MRRPAWNSTARIAVFALALSGLPITTSAQEVEAVLAKAASTMNPMAAKTIRFSVAGSGYEVRPAADPSTWRHTRVSSETRELDLERPAFREGDHLITTESPWEEQFELWTIPQAFLKGAKDNPFL